jgi:hypothetical protein
MGDELLDDAAGCPKPLAASCWPDVEEMAH